MTVGRIIAIGDVHGEYEMLTMLLDKLQVEKGDTLIFLGDYVDRGPDSKKVIEKVINLKRYRGAIALRGNHEDMMLDAILDAKDGWHKLKYLKGGTLWLMNGGDATIRSYEGSFPPRSHIEFMQLAQSYYRHEIRDKEYFFVHGGFNPYHPIREQLSMTGLSEARWNRGHLTSKWYKWGDNQVVVCGHTPQKTPLVKKHVICLDGGATFEGYGHLHAGVWEGEDFQTVSVHRSEVYEKEN